MIVYVVMQWVKGIFIKTSLKLNSIHLVLYFIGFELMPFFFTIITLYGCHNTN